MIISLRTFKLRVMRRKTALRRFLTRLEKKPPKKLDELTATVEKDLWKEIDCLACANCCKTMTPTYTAKDIKRISAHLGMTAQQFKDKWLRKERGTGDWLNKTNPCQFLDLKTNMCSIYEVRPADCAGFPHLPKKKMVDYMHVHKQNVEYCPATFRMVEKIMKKLK
ncbi:MAG: zinc/iron-chelating domain-containing protein [Chitinophagaceae bacterium]